MGIERFVEDCYAIFNVVLLEDSVGDHHLQVLAQHEQNILHHFVGLLESRVLVDDGNVGLDPLWCQVLLGHGLELKGVGLEISQPFSDEDFVCCVNFLNALLKQSMLCFALLICFENFESLPDISDLSPN